MQAAYYLGRIGKSQAYGPLVKAIGHPVPMVRHNAINAMIYLKQADLAADSTIWTVENRDEESWVIDSAIALLRQLTEKENKVRAIRALTEYIPRASYPRQKDAAEVAIRTLEQ